MTVEIVQVVLPNPAQRRALMLRALLARNDEGRRLHARTLCCTTPVRQAWTKLDRGSGGARPRARTERGFIAETIEEATTNLVHSHGYLENLPRKVEIAWDERSIAAAKAEASAGAEQPGTAGSIPWIGPDEVWPSVHRLLQSETIREWALHTPCPLLAIDEVDAMTPEEIAWVRELTKSPLASLRAIVTGQAKPTRRQPGCAI